MPPGAADPAPNGVAPEKRPGGSEVGPPPPLTWANNARRASSGAEGTPSEGFVGVVGIWAAAAASNWKWKV